MPYCVSTMGKIDRAIIEQNHIDGLELDCGISCAFALEMPQSRAEASICTGNNAVLHLRTLLPEAGISGRDK